MTIRCVWKHNGNATLLHAVEYAGAYTRGESLEIAASKMQKEIASYLKCLGEDVPANIDLAIKDMDSDVLFESEKRR